MVAAGQVFHVLILKLKRFVKKRINRFQNPFLLSVMDFRMTMLIQNILIGGIGS